MARKNRDKPPPPIVRLEGGLRLSPVTASDAEEILKLPPRTEFDLVIRSRRSLQHHRLYWRMLQNVVEATGRWESREVLHTALKVKLGYTEPIFGMDGKVIGMMPHSTAFAEMNQQEFTQFFDRARNALAEAIEADPLAFMGS